jgi:hypothetical protein
MYQKIDAWNCTFGDYKVAHNKQWMNAQGEANNCYRTHAKTNESKNENDKIIWFYVHLITVFVHLAANNFLWSAHCTCLRRIFSLF